MTIAATTDRAEQRPCSKCGTLVEHREVATMSCAPVEPIWRAEPHRAPCGQRCFGAGARASTRPWGEMHGWGDRCPKCGPLRVLPEVAAEMRGRAKSACLVCRDIGADLLRALDEIDKLRAELADARTALGDAREQMTGLDMMVALHEERTREDAYVLWAALQAMVNDCHAPQDMLTAKQWAHAQDLLVELDQRVNADGGCALQPHRADAAEVTACEPDRSPLVNCNGMQVLTP